MSIRKAVSIIFIFDNQIFEITRQNYLRAFPGYTAFPGGKVDPEDEESTLEATLKNTLVREASEELGIDILKLEKSKVISKIELIALATSPEFNPARFETYFYKVTLRKKIEFSVDIQEFQNSSWLTASSLLYEFDQGKRLMVPPVRVIIEKLGRDFSYNEFIDLDKDRFGAIPTIEPFRNLIQVLVKSNTLPPADRTNMFVIGDETKFLVDPSPATIEEYRNLLNVVTEYKIKSIFLTHHHADHHQFSTSLARHLSCPILVSKDSYDRILKKHGLNYFENTEVKFVKEGDIIGKWLDRDVEVIEVPGHDEGQLALRPVTNEWCIVGDLFQGVGSVVIGDDEGDMTKYMNSLEKIISMNPAAVLPSHGIALGGTNILQKILKHRELREQEILDLYLENKSQEEILNIIYSLIPRKLHPYARKNIQSHLNKLSNENKIVLKI
jgi:glyoxylase-like metal-dependent hydrolase (beta-lactamase superfamily II)/8-oxo-dGTP pyrophosphatase MutT (NUDIX family)